MIGHLDKLTYADAKGFLDQTADPQALPFLIDIAPFMDEVVDAPQCDMAAYQARTRAN